MFRIDWVLVRMKYVFFFKKNLKINICFKKDYAPFGSLELNSILIIVI
jgi:hypothetical protein